MKDKNKSDSGYFPLTSWTNLEDIRKNPKRRRALLDEFLRRYRPALVAFLTRAMRLDPNLAEDLVQSFIIERILNDRIFESANRQVRFRNLIRKSLRNYCIDYFRGNHDIPASDALVFAESIEQLDEDALDQPWATAVFSDSLRRMREQSNYWNLFEAKILHGKSYAEIREAQQSPSKASNQLMTAKRQFNRLVNEVLEEQQLQSTSADIEEDLIFLKKCLASNRALSAAIDEATSKQTGSLSTMHSRLLDTTQYKLLDEESPEFDNEEDLREVISHFLTLPVARYLSEECERLPDQIDLTSLASGDTFGKLFDSDQCDFAHLAYVKRVFKTRAEKSLGSLPSKVNGTMAYACIAAAIRFHRDQAPSITSLPKSKILEGLIYFRSQPWMPSQVAESFQAASKLLEG